MTDTTITLARIRAHRPSNASLTKLFAALGKTRADNEPLAFARILDILGVQDTLWCLRTLDDLRPAGMIAGRIALRVVPIYEARYPGDLRPRRAAELAASGTATAEELRTAAGAARAARADALAANAYVAAWAAGAAARAASAARDAAIDAAWDAATAVRAAEIEAQAAIIREVLG